ncbi:uncharacterized protein FRV6_01704 [Fusarium oxysporum]|uniref:Uncharacterized protein n=1 Tax=Fusarium oxysporum TaxID=5507 RepID=A0A2H3SLX1_FUSOX|nr:uncharacterized protein FRV6_01704 [Fusarium oxysporum]
MSIPLADIEVEEQ